MSDHDIYEPPQSDLSINEQQTELPIASRGQRFANMLIDYVCFYVFAILFGLVLGFSGMLDTYLESEPNIGMEYLLGIIMMFLYYTPQEAMWGKTIGKRITKTAVVTTDGDLISWGHALVRTIGRIIPFEAFSFFGNQGGEGQPIGWHDSLANTKVVSFK